jgi:hypothetical protein
MRVRRMGWFHEAEYLRPLLGIKQDYFKGSTIVLTILVCHVFGFSKA